MANEKKNFFINLKLNVYVYAASIAQWLEHWSCKPGVGSSILPGGFEVFYY